VPIECPHCGVATTLNLRKNWDGQTRRGGPVKQAAWTCRSCGEPITGELEQDPIEGYLPKPGESYPAKMTSPPMPESLPADIARDATSAHRCFGMGEWRASAAMARRAIQGACIDKGAPEDADLFDQIFWLKDEGLILPMMNDVAHQIRIGGNAGAHPDKDGLKDVDQVEAKKVLVFLDDFIRFVYEIPERLGYSPADADQPADEEPEQ
jgi:hypothetical protein